MKKDTLKMLRAFLVTSICIVLVTVVAVGALTAVQNTESLVFGREYARMTFAGSGDKIVFGMDGSTVSAQKSEISRIVGYGRVVMPCFVNSAIWLFHILFG